MTATATTSAKTCNCPEGFEEVYEGVIVTGHDLATCLLGAPRTYVWREAGGPAVGTLHHYGRAWEYSHYEGTRDRLSTDVMTWDDEAPVSHPVQVIDLGTDEEQRMRYRLVVGNEAVVVSIDGRA